MSRIHLNPILPKPILPKPILPKPILPKPILLGVATVLCAVLAACGGNSPGTGGSADASGNGDPITVEVGRASNGAAKPASLTVPVDPEVTAIRAELPATIRDAGTLQIGGGSLPVGTPPLGFIGDDQSTFTGSEPDLGRLVAAVFGLTAKTNNATWENLFVGIDSGRTDVGFSNITDTEQRKQKYDFACYRKDNVSFATLAADSWTFTGAPEDLAGKTIVVDKGTNQEKLLLGWQAKLRAEGKDLTVKYFPDNNATYLALSSRQVDGYLAPNPSVTYHVTRSEHTPNPLRVAGSYSGAGQSLQGLICATTKKDNGLAKPLADAINYLIEHGQYRAWLDAWHLTSEAVPRAELNPPGLPVTNS
jgi:polar amino acid transport system substrate-binding protein